MTPFHVSSSSSWLGTGYLSLIVLLFLLPLRSVWGGENGPVLPPQVIHSDGQLYLKWHPSPGVNAYNLYLASESGVDSSNYTTMADGAAHINVTSPLTLSGLANNTPYYLVLTVEKQGGVVESSVEVTATPSVTPSGYIDVDGGWGSTIALRRDGRVMFWGKNDVLAAENINTPMVFDSLAGVASRPL